MCRKFQEIQQKERINKIRITGNTEWEKKSIVVFSFRHIDFEAPYTPPPVCEFIET
jgi:hypothetical protein